MMLPRYKPDVLQRCKVYFLHKLVDAVIIKVDNKFLTFKTDILGEIINLPIDSYGENSGYIYIYIYRDFKKV